MLSAQVNLMEKNILSVAFCASFDPIVIFIISVKYHFKTLFLNNKINSVKIYFNREI